MTDKPIIFSAPMIRALLAGTKTQTRRTSGLADVNENPDAWSLHNVGPLGYMAKPSAKGKFGATFESRQIEPGALHVCPQRLPIAPGDRLWVRETVARQETDQGVGYQTYAADGSEVWPLTKWYHQRKTVSCIHMPRWASRLTLTVTDVRVQRLQEISEADAWAEGCKPDPDCTDDHGHPFPAEEPHPKCGTIAWDCARDWFADLWNSLHGTDAWYENPWVAAYSFDVHRCNIDQRGA